MSEKTDITESVAAVDEQPPAHTDAKPPVAQEEKPTAGDHDQTEHVPVVEQKPIAADQAMAAPTVEAKPSAIQEEKSVAVEHDQAHHAPVTKPVPVVEEKPVAAVEEAQPLIAASLLVEEPIVASANAPANKLEKYAKAGSSPIALVVIAIIGLIVPVLQLVIGWEYSDRCPVSRNIPVYLMWAGGLGIIGVLLNLVRGYLSLKMLKTASKPAETTEAATVRAKNKPLDILISVIVGCLGIFLFVWFIIGCFWIFGVWSKVQYAPDTSPFFCQRLLYRFAYIHLILPILSLVLCYCCPLCCVAVAFTAVAARQRQSTSALEPGTNA